MINPIDYFMINHTIYIRSPIKRTLIISMIENISQKEIERRNKIKSSLKAYFMTEQGNAHKNKLSQLQAKRMAKYNEFINNHNNDKREIN